MDETDHRDRPGSSAGQIHFGEPRSEAPLGIKRRAAKGGLVAGAAAGVIVVGALIWSIGSLTGLRGGSASTEPRQLGKLERFEVGGRPIRRVAIGHGAAWFIVQDHGANGRLVLVRIDDRTGEVRRIDGIGEPQYVAATQAAIWVASCTPRTGRDGGCSQTRIFELDPSKGTPVGSVDTLAGQAVSLAVGLDAVWEVVYVNGGGDVLVRVDPGTRRLAATIPLPGCCGLDLAVGEKAVWVQNDKGVVKVDPSANKVESLIRLKNTEELAVGGGFVWVNTARTSSSAPVALIDAASDRIIRSIPGPGFGTPVFSGGRLWIAVVGGGRRIAIQSVPRDGAASFSTHPVSPTEGPLKDATVGFGGPGVILGIGDGAIWTGTDQSEQVVRIELPQSLTN